MKKRLFIGTFIDTHLFEFRYKKIKEDFTQVAFGKWVEIENLHYTYKFLGDVEEKLIPKIKSSLKDILKVYKTEIILSGLAVFPHPGDPKILSVKVFNTGNDVMNAQPEIEERLEKLGFPKEKRKFAPHTSLLRIKKFDPKFKDVLSNYREYVIGSMPVFSINLIDSVLTKKGPIYTVLK